MLNIYRYLGGNGGSDSSGTNPAGIHSNTSAACPVFTPILRQIANATVCLAAACPMSAAVAAEVTPRSNTVVHSRFIQSSHAAMEKFQEHEDFLQRMTAEDAPSRISPQMAQKARWVWRGLWEASNRRLPIPAAATGPDGRVFYAWNRGKHHFEAELLPGQDEVEYYYRDRDTKESWAIDLRPDGALPAQIIRSLKFFV